jgi:hypothetical protein
MSKRYPGGILRKTPQTPTQTSAQGIWDMASVTQAVKENTWPIAGVPDPISKSLRFRNSASARLTRTPSVAGNKQIFTVSFWLKTAKSNFDYYLFEASTDGGNNERTVLAFNAGKLQFRHIDGGSAVLNLETTQVFRDPSAWYHIVLAVDTTQATSSNRVKMYLNGSQITAFGTASYPTQNLNTDWNGANAHSIGSSTFPDSYADMYLTEFYNIDGQALTPSSFGSTNDQTGVWQPIAYTGTYGTNGFYLPFSNTTSTATLGYDFSGNSNNWTTNNISLTSGSTYDSMVDVPTQWIPYNTAGDTGALYRGNYCVLNPLDKDSNITVSNGNLAASTSTVDHNLIRSTIAIPSSGKFYAEMRFDQTMTGNPAAAFALISPSASLSAHIASAGNYSVYGSSSTILQSGATAGATVTSMTSGQIWQFAVDADNNQAWIGLNNAWYNVYTSGATTGNPSAGTNPTFTGTMAGLFLGADFVNSSGSINFGQQPFVYAPPSGFKTLNTTNLPTPTIGATASTTANKYFDATLFTGTGANATITNSGSMQPDFIWGKSRSNAFNHILMDSVRGTGVTLFSNSTSADYAVTDAVTAFNSNGFNYGVDPTCNTNGSTNVFWQWRASNATAVTNTAGSITSTVSANTSAGFSIVTYTGNGTSSQTCGHGLGVIPSMVIWKNRNDVDAWIVYHSALTTSEYLVLNTTAAKATVSGLFTGISSTVLPLNNVSAAINANGFNYVAYCFAQIAGYSAFGSYTGNGSADGPFIFTGFKPKFIMWKNSNATSQWRMHDTSRSPYNASVNSLRANGANAEDTSGAGDTIDFLSNGFKVRAAGTDINDSGNVYIYMAFCESPFKYALAR